MPLFPPRLSHLVCLVAVSCFLCSCGIRPYNGPTSASGPEQARARRLLAAVLAKNQGLDSIKGMGRVHLVEHRQKSVFRAAWIGKRPGKLRLEVLAATGQPVISFASDGREVYLLSYADNRLYRKKASENSLKRIVSISMAPKDLLSLLCGRLPVDADAALRISRGDGGGLLLTLYDARRGHLDTIRFDDDGTSVREFTRRRRQSGKLLYRVVFDGMRDVGGFQVPRAVTVENDDGVAIHIDVDRCWVNPTIREDSFVLHSSRAG